jgi:hypothetical protein
MMNEMLRLTRVELLDPHGEISRQVEALPAKSDDLASAFEGLENVRAAPARRSFQPARGPHGSPAP